MADLPVYTGYWIDYSQGSSLGATITLKASHGTYIVAAAAIVIQIIGTAIWSLLAFAFYQWRTRNKPFRSGFAAQSQIIIRNEGDPLQVSWELAKLGYSWRGHASKARTRGFSLAIIPFLLYVGIIAAGVLVSDIAVNAYDSSHVLIKSLECGAINADINEDQAFGFANVYVNASIIANTYARTCYAGIENAAIACNFYQKQNLPYQVNRNASCPASDPAVCAGPVIEFATPPLDSHEDFGINAPKKDRITIQKWGTCAPLSTEYIESKVTLLDFGLRLDNQTYYDRLYAIGTYADTNLFGGSNFSYQYPEIQYGLGQLGYQTAASISLFPHDQSNWVAPPEFRSIQGDVTLVYLATNAIQYTEPVEDPFFLAQNLSTPSGNNQSYYLGSRYVNAMLCVDQYQICNPNVQKCTERTGVTQGAQSTDDIQRILADLELNPRQNATFQRTASLGSVTNFWSAVNNVPNAIQATERLSIAPLSLPLPSNQWEIETEGWFQTSLATIQDFVVEYSHKFASYKYAASVVPPDTPEAESECNTQRISTPPYYQNYSFAGIMIVACLGIFFTLFALTIRMIVFSLPDRQEGKAKYHKRYAYERDNTMSLYKRANTLSDHDTHRWKPVRNDTGNTQGSQSETETDRTVVTAYKGAREKEDDDEGTNGKLEQEQKSPMLPRLPFRD